MGVVAGEENQSDLLGDGFFSFDADSNPLTLKGVYESKDSIEYGDPVRTQWSSEDTSEQEDEIIDLRLGSPRGAGLPSVKLRLAIPSPLW